MKVVIDSKVYLSGTFWEEKPKDIIHLAKKGLIQVFVSKAILDEIKEGLTREDEPFKLSKNEVEKIIQEDNKILECAIESETKFIISGDPHLKNLKEFNNIKIVSPSAFLEMFS